MQPGERLGDRFELEQPIGSGGMGTVFRACDPVSGETVAVKVISNRQRHRTERFAREVKLLAGLSHPGIVRYIADGVTPSGELFLVPRCPRAWTRWSRRCSHGTPGSARATAPTSPRPWPRSAR